MSKQEVPISGAIIYWSLHDSHQKPMIDQALADLGVQHLQPRPKTPFQALSEAVKDVLGHHEDMLVRPLKDHEGVEVVEEIKGDFAEGNRYVPRGRAYFHESDLEYFNTTGFLRQYDREIIDIYFALRRTYGAACIAHVLGKVIQHLGGTTLRPTGGVYWLHSVRLDAFMRFAIAVHNASGGKSNIYTAHVARTEESLRALREALLEDSRDFFEKTRSDLQNLKLNRPQVERRRGQIDAMRQKIATNRDILRDSAQALEHQVEELENMALQAEITAMGL